VRPVFRELPFVHAQWKRVAAIRQSGRVGQVQGVASASLKDIVSQIPAGLSDHWLTETEAAERAQTE